MLCYAMLWWTSMLPHTVADRSMLGAVYQWQHAGIQPRDNMLDQTMSPCSSEPRSIQGRTKSFLNLGKTTPCMLNILVVDY